MAIYHLSVKTVNRSKGGNAIASAAYRARMDLKDLNTGEEFRYGKMGDHRKTVTHYPNNFTDKTVSKLDLENLWSLAEKANTRKNGNTAREVEVALPKELTKEQQELLLNHFVRNNFTKKGMIAQVSIHEGKGENPHSHILLSTRKFNQDKMAFEKSPVREWSQKDALKKWREEWAKDTNGILKHFGHDVKVDHRSLKEQGIDRLPQTHEGPKVRAMEKDGIVTDKGTWNLVVKRNELEQRIEHERLRRQRSINRDYGIGW